MILFLYLFAQAFVWCVKMLALATAAMIYVSVLAMRCLITLIAYTINYYVEKKRDQSASSVGSPDRAVDNLSGDPVRSADRL